MTVPASQAASARRSARRRTVEGDRTDRRQAILLAAEKLFAQRGYHAVTIRQIAEEAAVPLALVGYYFGQKHELFAAIFQHWSPTIERAAGAACATALRRRPTGCCAASSRPSCCRCCALRASAEGEFYALLVARELAYATPRPTRAAPAFRPAGRTPSSTHCTAACAAASRARCRLGLPVCPRRPAAPHQRPPRRAPVARRRPAANDPAACELLVRFIEGGMRATLGSPLMPAPHRVDLLCHRPTEDHEETP
jgi:AcrR family transcriptional regulator